MVKKYQKHHYLATINFFTNKMSVYQVNMDLKFTGDPRGAQKSGVFYDFEETYR